MQEPKFRRVDLAALARQNQGRGGATAHTETVLSIRWWVPVVCVMLAVAQSILWIAANNIRGTALAGTLIPVMGFALLLLILVLINPLLGLGHRWLRTLRPFGRAELMTLFATMLVTAGISTFGLVEQLVPLIAAPFDPSWNTIQRGWDVRLLPFLNEHLYITNPELIATFRNGFSHEPGPDATWAEWTAVHLETIRQVPWMVWLKPLGYWMIFVAAAYGLFYSLAYIVLPLWADREKLIFPLSKLPESLLPESDAHAGRVPAIFQSVGFWGAFLVVFAVLSWNGIVGQQWIAGMNPIRLGMDSGGVGAMVAANATFAPLAGSIGLMIMFTAIGLAFLLPQEMSFSVWFYYLLSRLLLLSACWLGFGRSGADFPSDLWSNANFNSAQGAGGMFVFAAISLGRCVLEYRRLASNATAFRRAVLAIPPLTLAVCLAILLAWLRWNNIPLLLAGFILLVMTLLTVGMMRIVAESGVYWLQAHTGVFHLHKMLGLGAVVPASIMAPIMPIYAIFFLDLKSFIAPNLANAAKMHADVGGNRVKFHATIILSMIASVVSSTLYTIFLAYSRGANRMHTWFYSQYPQLVMDTARNLADRTPRLNVPLTAWFIFGGLWVALSFYLRRTMFWFPHPIGYIMLVNPLMNQLWLSFFIAWCAKKFVVKYGGKATFDRTRTIAIGLIVGELVAIAVWTGIALYAGQPLPNINLNRYGA